MKNATPRHIVICGLSGFTIFFDTFMKGTILEKQLFDVKCVLWFCLQILFEAFLILRRFSEILPEM
jgi:hypothetical protein